MVKHSTHYPEIKGLNPVAGTKRDKMVIANSCRTVVCLIMRFRVHIQAHINTRRKEMEENSFKENNSNGEEEKLEDIQRGQMRWNSGKTLYS
jgi:hypothetical protein